MRNAVISFPTMASPNSFLDSVQESVHPKIFSSDVQHIYHENFEKALETFVLERYAR